MSGTELRLIGGALLAGAGTLLGHEKKSALLGQQRCLEQLCRALGRMESELLALQTPMPELLAKLSDCPFFLLISAGFGGEPLEQLWRRAAQAQPIPERDRETLGALGAVAGRYDAARQAAEIGLARQRLAESAAALAVEVSGRGRRFAGLGAALGAMLAAILF